MNKMNENDSSSWHLYLAMIDTAQGVDGIGDGAWPDSNLLVEPFIKKKKPFTTFLFLLD